MSEPAPMIFGLAIHVVEEGTEISGPDGAKLIVTNTNVVQSGGKLYCTALTIEALRANSVKNSKAML
ncbi:hypothetical protein [Rhodobacter maris]|uniref:Uncharacterized protein n=1 Tax=Rhodobacter maris TaxID=446682 RepID=A0A285SNF0_9RHOB|nr:hypothetical protein [Rhodobacter maris]SOC09618.1 hypothetical protein SAMN05877831_107162 [Rhodobacter maris]